jgi:hypothetical protein
MDIFWTFFLSITTILVLVLAIRHRLVAWGWNFALMALVVYSGLYLMSGQYRSALFFSTIQNIHGDVEVLYATIIEKDSIILLIRKHPGEYPYYLRIKWSQKSEDQLKKAKMVADQQHKGIKANVDELSKAEHNIESNDEKASGSIGDGDTPDQHKGQAPKSGGIKLDDKPGGERMFYPDPVQGEPGKDPTSDVRIDQPGSSTN